MGHRHSSSSRHIPLSCSQKHAALNLNGIPSVSKTHLLHNHGQHKAKQYRLTARITLAKLRSLHTAAAQYPRTMAIRLRIIAIISHTFAYFHVTHNTFGAALRWHGHHSAEVNENINLGYSHDQGYS